MTSNTLNIIKQDGLEYILFPKLAATGVVRHIFSTRLGGVSVGRYAEMNMSFTNGDKRENVLENYRRLCGAVGIEVSHLVLSKQTHTDNIKNVTEEDIGRGIFKEPFSDIDGLITDRSGIALVTQYADCTPLLFCDPVNRVIASSHAGWRGTAKRIGAKTVEKMVGEYGCKRENIVVGIGPGIGRCCYEVDDPVYDAFASVPELNCEKVFVKKENGKYMLDNTEANRQILLAAGIKAENTDVSDLCTCCNSAELHSHRATHGERGNMAAIIELI